MKKVSISIIAMFFCFSAWAQTDKKTSKLSESLYILPKAGMNVEFEAAIAAHNKKFHPEGPHLAVLRRIEYGEKAGWYVWIMKGTYSSLDTRPTLEGGHQADWDKTVGPTVEEYGATTLFALDEDLSYGMDIFNKSKMYNVWAVDIKMGQYDRFKALIEKIKKTYESMGNRAFLVFNNQIHTKGGADVGLLWSFNTYADLDTDWGTKAAYEKLYGADSWKAMLTEWNEVVVDWDEEIRSKL
ncbi:MAG TPA: hypothetical protein PKL31_11190 [Fulvivirga sp.]|nr:hypothetical protein [Fulvivirga sp.]